MPCHRTTSIRHVTSNGTSDTILYAASVAVKSVSPEKLKLTKNRHNFRSASRLVEGCCENPQHSKAILTWDYLAQVALAILSNGRGALLFVFLEIEHFLCEADCERYASDE